MTRRAAEIGAGLAPVRSPRPIPRGERIHVIGAAGAGASAAMLLAHHAGARVSGCDLDPGAPYADAIRAAGLTVVAGHDARHVLDDGRPLVDRVAVTKALTAVRPDHPELDAARAGGIVPETWQQVVADVAATAGRRLVGVSGTHGKTTTAGWLVHVLWSAGLDPSAFVGGLLPEELLGGPAATARWGSGPHLVVEADEYAGNFDAYHPAVGLVNNIEWDHPDVFGDETAVVDAFEAWVRRYQGGGEPPTLVANAGDPGTKRLLDRLAAWDGRIVTFRLDGDVPRAGGRVDVAGDLEGDADRPTLAFRVGALPVTRAALPLPGRRYAEDALAVVAMCSALGVPPGAIEEGLTTFRGARRRLELIGTPRDIVVLDDYGHHPTAIRAATEAARARYPGRRLWLVYEPLTHHRTAAMLDGFADALSEGDEAVIADIWAGRDQDTETVRAHHLAAAITARGRVRAQAPGSVDAAARALARQVRPGELVLVMGGGRSYLIARELVRLLSG